MTMQDDYISRQAVLNLPQRITRNFVGEVVARSIDVEDIKDLPAADVVPVVHGEWLDGYKMQTCSLCKCRGKKSWTFCPHRGARMIYGERKG